jgi:uncharacterized protein (DUF1800 family)
MPADKQNGETGAWWGAWQPSDDEPWDARRVVHLHRRAGFAATWKEVQRDLKDGPGAAIDRVLHGQARMQAIPNDFAEMADVIGAGAVGSGSTNRLKAWWMYRLLFSPDALTEKLTLVWHNHFATSNRKVDDLGAMHHQNHSFRGLAKSRFGELLSAMISDPALLNWLDAPANKKGSPNENLARELMELFTIGIGNYSENDVKQAARALTGWTVNDGQQAFDEGEHDAGEKTILGKTGRWNAKDLVTILLAHPATSRRLAWRICDLLMGENVVTPEAIAALAAGLRERDLDVGWAVETALRSKLFFSEPNIGSRVATPVEFIVNSVRSLEAYNPPPSTLLLAEWSARMGQDLFYPPNVGGWTGGRDWLGSRHVVARANFAAALVEGRLTATPSPPNLRKLASEHTGATTLQSCSAFIGQAMTGQADEDLIRESIAAAKGAGLDHDQLQLVIALMLSRPESQLL